MLCNNLTDSELTNYQLLFYKGEWNTMHLDGN